MQNSDFNHWAVIEVFGHEKFAGEVSTAKVGDASMIMLEVPEVENGDVTLPGFVKYINHSSVFSITPVSEEYAIKMASQLAQHPVQGYEHKEVIRQLAKKATEEMTLAEIQKLMSNWALEASISSKSKNLASSCCWTAS